MSCTRCGQCCRIFVLCRTKGMSDEALHYLRTRGFHTDQGFLVAPWPCPQLDDPGPGLQTTCRIHDTPEYPTGCRQFKGRRIARGKVFYVPEFCTAALPE